MNPAPIPPPPLSVLLEAGDEDVADATSDVRDGLELEAVANGNPVALRRGKAMMGYDL